MKTSTLLLLGAFAAFSSAARGQEASKATASQASAAQTSDAASAAKKAYDDAGASYARGDVSGALRAMEDSYELSQRPQLLFNLGELHRELGQCVEALRSYQQYLALALDGSLRAEAEREVSELEPRCGSKPVAITAPGANELTPKRQIKLPPATPAPTVSYWTTNRKLGFAALGAAVLAGATATYLAVEAADAQHTTEQRLKAIQAPGSTAVAYSEEDRSREAAGTRDAKWSRLLVASAAGFAAAGVTFLIVGAPRRENQHSSFTVGCAPGTLSAAYAHSF